MFREKMTFFVKNFVKFCSLKRYAQSTLLFFRFLFCAKQKVPFLVQGYAHEQSLQPSPLHRPIQCCRVFIIFGMLIAIPRPSLWWIASLRGRVQASYFADPEYDGNDCQWKTFHVYMVSSMGNRSQTSVKSDLLLYV